MQHYDNCLELTLNSDKYECTRCAYDYSLIDKKGCVYTPSLYDGYFENYHRNHYIALYMNSYGQIDYDYALYKNFDSNYSNFKENDYIYMRNADLYSCQKAVNLGTEDNPLYSCIKCNSHYKDLYDDVATITEINSNISFCMRQKKRDDLEYCSKATYKMTEGKEVFNCTECIKNYVLAFNKNSKTYYCAATNATNKCLVLYCKNCNPNDGYICEECLPDYEVSKVTGSCVKKTEVVPAVTWKDIYKLEMNGVKEVNNKVIQGPTLSMTGITSSQINTRHAFIIYLTFKLKTSLRYLDENEITMEAICEIKEGVEQTSNDVNLVEYECVGITNTTEDLSNYQLSDIKEANNEGSLKQSNLGEIVNTMKEKGELANLETKTESTFTIEDLVKIVIFQMKDNILNISANDFKFDFNIEGTLNKEITLTKPIETNFELSEIEKNATCKFSVGTNKLDADLNCNLDVKDYKNIETFSFKTAQIITEDNEIYLSKLNDIILINSKEKEDDDNNKTVIIIIVVVCSVVVAAGLGIGIFFLVKKLRTKTNGVKEAEENNQRIDVKNNDGGAESGNRVISYGNTNKK